MTNENSSGNLAQRAIFLLFQVGFFDNFFHSKKTLNSMSNHAIPNRLV